MMAILFVGWRRTILVAGSMWLMFACMALCASGDFVQQAVLEKTSLRGYGEVSGIQSVTDNGSVLEISCEDEGKAKLVQAKYLSDIQLLPRTSPLTISGVAAVSVEGQGVIASLRVKNKVTILASPNEASFQKLLAEATRQIGAKFSSSSEVDVPMWLDRWDKFGFRFYYRAWQTPKETKFENYDALYEFDYAKKMERSGFVLWVKSDFIDTAAGLSGNVYWDWALREAASQGLPVALNLSGGYLGNWVSFNAYWDEMSQKAPQFCGNFHGVADYSLGGCGSLSWNSVAGKDAQFGAIQEVLKELLKYQNVTTILEPHTEMSHGGSNMLMEYGPLADNSYREYLKKKYSTASALSRAWGVEIRSWDVVRAPELAEFLGFGGHAIDLSGEWKIAYEKISNSETPDLYNKKNKKLIETAGSPTEWFAESFDDSSWPIVTAPGHDRTMFLLRRPAVYRRSIDIPKAWLKGKSRIWLYVWDLNSIAGGKVKATVNGKTVGEEECENAVPHWGAYEVSQALREGKNQIALGLPQGILAYRIYLSPDAPTQYPNLGEGRNRQWVDFVEWSDGSRIDSVKRGMEMIRQVDSNRQIDLMAPGGYDDDVKQLAVMYGGNFKNTGYMGAFWADELPAQMRGVKFPFSLEPGGPAKDLAGFKKMMGLYATEGIQAIDYFYKIGDILWNPEIRGHFEDTLPMIKVIGKYHCPTAEVAALYSTENRNLTGYPWGQDPNTNLGSGRLNWNVRAGMIGVYESDALTESSFASGDAARYKVIIDTNTSIMEAGMVSEIEKYVRDGGTFVTFVQTGRHTPSEKDSWPIAKLTGYEVTGIDPLRADGDPIKWRNLKLAPEQKVFEGKWIGQKANGLSLKKVSPEAKDLVLWEDGSTAIGVRQLGKGYVVNVGCKFHGDHFFNRIEGKPDEKMEALTEMFAQILKWRGIAPVGASFVKQDWNLILRHYISNNGLYDVWVAWNRSGDQTSENKISLPPSISTKWAWDVRSGSVVEVADGKIPLRLAPLEYRVYLVPRNTITQAPREWFDLQRDWWRGTSIPPKKQLTPPKNSFLVDLTDGWAFKFLKEGEDVKALAASEYDDSSWERKRMGSILNRDKKSLRLLFRKTFTVPKEWDKGNPTIWMKGGSRADFSDKGRVWLDGKIVSDWGNNAGLCDENPDNSLKAGTRHTLAIEIEGKGQVVGALANVWLWYWPASEREIDLSGGWSPSGDALAYGSPVQLPGRHKAMMLKRRVKVPADMAGQNVMIDVVSDKTYGVLINGRWIRRSNHLIGDHFQINITPWLRFGGDNEIELVNMEKTKSSQDPSELDVKSVSLKFYKKGFYP